MARDSFLHVAFLLFASGFVFFLHSSMMGPAIREDMHVGEVSAPPSIQIGLGRCLRDESVRVAVRGPYEVRGKQGILAQGGELSWSAVRAAGAALSVGETVFQENPITLAPERDATIEVEYRRDPRGQPISPLSVRYHGALILHALKDGKLALVNEVDLEDYLKGVVGKEMNLREDDEALKAQIIAARTYAVHEQRLQRVRRVKGEKFDLYDDERSQMYGGLERETDRAIRLVEGTRGLFLMYEDRVVRTFYSTNCGGHTEPAWEVLTDETERMPPLSGRACDYCAGHPAYRWKEPVLVSKKEIVERCLPWETQGARIKSVEISKSLPGGHVMELAVALENSSKVLKLRANDDFRRNVGPKFRSLLWEKIEDRGDAIAIFGRGWGHGAGMCQAGACEMARGGKTAAEILEYYYPGAKVQKLY